MNFLCYKKVLVNICIFENFIFCLLVWNICSSKSLKKIYNIQKRILKYLYNDHGQHAKRTPKSLYNDYDSNLTLLKKSEHCLKLMNHDISNVG